MSAKLVPPSEMIHYSIERRDVNMRDTHGVLASLLAGNRIDGVSTHIWGRHGLGRVGLDHLYPEL